MKQTNESSADLVDCVTANKCMHQEEDENCDLVDGLSSTTKTDCID